MIIAAGIPTVSSAAVTALARPALRLDVAFRLRGESPHGEPHLAALLIVLEKLNVNFVTFLEHVGNVLGLVPCDFGYMEKAFLSRKNLHEGAELKYGLDSSMVNLAYLRNSADAFDPLESLVHAVLVVSEDVYYTLVVLLGYGDGGAGLLLDLLDGLSALSDDGTDEVLRNPDLLDPRNKRLVVCARLVDALEHLAHDVHSAFMSLLEGLGENVIGKSVDLHVHLGGGNSVGGSRYLEIHVSEVVLVSEDVGEDGVAVVRVLFIGDEAHGDSCYRLLYLNSGIHEREAASAD